jgi:S-adenosylmethionine:tRNA ribosyltransferase-isomerase
MTYTLDDFDYDLPKEFIAQSAAEPRDSSRLLVIHRNTGRLEHRIFRDLPEYLNPVDVLVMNQSRVIPARLHATKIPSGGKAEILLLQRIDATHWTTMVGGSRLIVGTSLQLRQLEGIPTITATITEVWDESRRVVAFSEPVDDYLYVLGELPLPPYIEQPLIDPERYQTVYSRTLGSVAAPTAGLHFTPELLLKIRDMGASLAFCTLHVGIGTFLTPKPEQVTSRRLHEEYAELTADDARVINEGKLRGGRIIAVGTTSVRTLETASLRSLGIEDPYADVELCPWKPVSAFTGNTDLFIQPGFRWRAVDAMITNFHLPKSSLMMLVSAFAGKELMLHAYEEAKREGYRFFSLGDACLIL